MARAIDRRRFLYLLGCGMVGTIAAPAGRLPTLHAESAPSNLNAMLEPIRRGHNMPALAAAFVRGSDLVAQGAVGTRRASGHAEVELDDRFHLGSCTKAMTATVMARLVERGEIEWSTRLADALPELAEAMDPGFHGVTVEQLLAHRSGLPGVETPSTYNPRQRQLLQDFHAASMRSRPITEQRRIFARRVLSDEPVAEPGTLFNYSNFGYVVAGAVIEAVTRESWEDVTRRELFEPLGMASAGFGPPGEGNDVTEPWGHLASGCEPVAPGPKAGTPKADNPPVYGPTGRVHSPMADWAQYASLHLRGARGEAVRLLDTDTFRELHQDRSNQGYALGWSVRQRSWADGRALTHAGSNTLWYAVVWLAPERNAALLAAANCGSDRGFQAVDAAVGAMIRRFL